MNTRDGYLELAQLLRKAAAVLDSMAGVEDHGDHAPRIMDLRQKIGSLLAKAPKGLTSVEIAEELYTADLGISFDRFLRRVNVMVSSMHTKTKEVEPRGSGSPRRWKLNETTTPPEGGAIVVTDGQ